MRIAQVSPLFESVPPRCYGGTERVVHHLTEALVAKGHEVTLYASGDSWTSAELESVVPKSLRASRAREPFAAHALMFERLRQEAEAFDLVHFHTEYMHFNVARALGVPTLSTMHGRMDHHEYGGLFREFDDLPLVSISESQRSVLPQAKWVDTIYHGLDRNAFKARGGDGGYLAFLGRISQEKRPDRAIEIARRCGLKIKIAAKIDRDIDGPYVREVEPLLSLPHVEYIGEITENQKEEFLGQALATLFPIDWPEPFGLVMIESLAVGTPVVAFRNGSVAEIIEHEKTGFVVDTVEEACAAVRRLESIDRRTCRAEFETRFTIERMVNDYVALYERMLNSRQARWQRSIPRWTVASSVLAASTASTSGGLV